jgi:hypothetical protein
MLLISFGYVPVRAQVFTYFFFMLTLYLLESVKKDQQWRLLWWLPPIQILWCNFHGGFVAGLGLIGLYAVGEWLSGRRIAPYLMIVTLATLATLANPYGIQYWAYTFHAIVMSRPEIDEWMSAFRAIQSHSQDLPAVIFIILAFFVFVLFIFRRGKELTDFLILIVTIYLGYRHIRHSVLFGLVFGSYVPVMLSGHWENLRSRYPFLIRCSRGIRLLPAVLLLSLYLMINPSLSLAVIPSFAIVTPPHLFPIGAIQWIKANHLKGNILPHFDWGEYIIWTCYPDCRVAMDGRYETVYKDHVSQEYFDFLIGRETWNVFLHKYPHDMILIHRNTRTYWLMLKEPSWFVAYSDQMSVLFIRKTYR